MWIECGWLQRLVRTSETIMDFLFRHLLALLILSIPRRKAGSFLQTLHEAVLSDVVWRRVIAVMLVALVAPNAYPKLAMHVKT